METHLSNIPPLHTRPCAILQPGIVLIAEQAAHSSHGAGFLGPAVDAGTAEGEDGVEGFGAVGAVAEVGFDYGLEHELAEQVEPF